MKSKAQKLFQKFSHLSKVLYKISKCEVHEYKLLSNMKKEQKICKTASKIL